MPLSVPLIASGKKLHPYNPVHGHPDCVPLVVHLELRARRRHGHNAADANSRLHFPEFAPNLKIKHMTLHCLIFGCVIE